MQTKPLKIVADSAIPFLRGVLEEWAEVTYLPGREISAAEVRNADALIIRTRTRCDSALLAGSRVKFIATATIGFDHIDRAWCSANGIEVATAAGCNARGVLQWMAAMLATLARRDGWQPQEKTLGVVGVGHVGSLVADYAASWGFRVVCCDPPREEREHLGFLPIEEVARQADILTFHTPLDHTTRHLADRRILDMMPESALLVNCSRGEVVDGEAVKASTHPFAFDVWEHEPHLDPELLARAEIATPHIAGYSAQGKAMATAMSVRAVATHFDLPLKDWFPTDATPSAPRKISWSELCSTMPSHYDIAAESSRLKQHTEEFERMRDSYKYREEYF